MKQPIIWNLLLILVIGFGQVEQSVAATPDVDIWKAAASGNTVAIRQHLEAGTDVDARDSAGGGTPLMVAAAFGQVEVVKFLIAKEANVNAASNDGATALHGAAFFCHTEIVKLLLGRGAVVDAKNIRGETPLSAVAGQWSPELEGIYNSLAELWNLQLDLDRIKVTRPKIDTLLRNAQTNTEA